MSLTTEEHALIKKIGECMVDFQKLPNWAVASEGDQREFATAVHYLQRQVMARCAQRTYPNLYPRGKHI